MTLGTLFFALLKDHMWWIFFFCFFVTSCNSKSPDYFLAEGRALNRDLIDCCHEINDLDDLIQALPYMQKQFNLLVDVMIEAKKWQKKHNVTWQPSVEDQRLSQELADEFLRLYAMPSARALIEKSQEPALLKLDSFDKKR